MGFIPQQRKLMGSSAQNISGVHWCRRRVRFNRVPEKVPEKAWEALVQSQVRFNRVAEKVPEKVWEALVQSQVRFNRVPEKVPEKVSSQVQRVPEKVAEAKPGQVHLTNGNPAEVFPALGFAARFKKICKHKTLRLLGVPPKLIFIMYLRDCLGLRSKK